mgnify:CR=1 FL=1
MSKLNGETAAVLTSPSVALRFLSMGAVAVAQVELFAGGVRGGVRPRTAHGRSHTLTDSSVSCGERVSFRVGCHASALTARLTEKLWQQIKRVYEDNGLKVIGEVNKKIVNFIA